MATTHDPDDFQDAMREAVRSISAEAISAVDLYVLEKGPLELERDGDGYKFIVKQSARLRLKEAEEIRADERKAILAYLRTRNRSETIDYLEGL